MRAATILLVDDDEVLNQVLRRVLTRDGYNVVEAGSVAGALERAREQRPSLGLIDLRLPDGDGVELADQLRRQVGAFPLILMTAYPLRLRDQPELAKGFAHVLTKPLNLEELRQAIETSLGAAPVKTEPAPEAPRPEPAAEPEVTSRPEPSIPTQRTPAPPAEARKRRYLRWAALAAAVVAVAGFVVAMPALGMPSVRDLFRPPSVRPVGSRPDVRARLVPEEDDTIELPREVAERLGVTSDPVQSVASPRPLELPGSLAFDPNRLGRVQARFGGEVIAIGTTTDHKHGGATAERELRYGDRVTKGQVMAVVLSKDLGEKKSELVDGLVRLWYDEALLESLERLVENGQTTPVNVRTQRAAVANDRNAVARVRRTLRTWRVADGEIKTVEDEAERVYRKQGERDVDKETEWAKVDVRAPFDSTIVEKNVSLHTIVDTTFDLFKVADLSRLGVLVHAYEEDLRELQALPEGHPWKLRASSDPERPLLKSDGIQRIGLVVDPTQHTDPVMGLVDNHDGRLRVGQFVTATVDLPAPPNVVALPASAIEENGAESVVFVQPDPSLPRYALRRVAVAMRLRDVVYVRSELTEQDRKKGLRAVQPGEYVVSDGVLELKAALEDLQAKKKAEK